MDAQAASEILKTLKSIDITLFWFFICFTIWTVWWHWRNR